MSASLASLARQSGLVIAVAAGVYCAADLGFAWLASPAPYAGSPERLTAAAYRNEGYFSEAFLRESFTQPGRWDTLPGTRVVLPAEFHGRWFHTDRLEPTGLVYRRTVPAGAGRRPVLILGGSTVYNSEVPDDLTLASQLGAMLERAFPGRYAVINAGVSSSNTAQELERLELELRRGLSPALVVSLSGFNDVWQGVYYGNPDGVMFSHDQRNPVADFVKAYVPLNIYRSVRRGVEAQRQRSAPAHLADPKRVEELVARTRDRHVANLLGMQRVLAERRIPLLAFLQPNATSGSCWTEDAVKAEDVREFLAWAEVRQPKWEAALRPGHAALRSAADELGSKGVRRVDLSEAFCGHRSPVFLDPVHVNSAGNRMLAEAMAPHLLPLLAVQ